MSSRRLLAVTVLFVVAHQAGVLAQPPGGQAQSQPPALVVEPVEFDRQVVASDAGFFNSLKLFVRQWRFGEQPDDIVMPVYRLDTLGHDDGRLILESLARSAGGASVPAVFLTRPVPGGDFVGGEVTIQVSAQRTHQVQDPWSDLIRNGWARVESGEDQGSDGLYLATSQTVEGLEPHADVVIFESVPQSRLGTETAHPSTR